MWSNEETFKLIEVIRCDVVKSRPLQSSNNNHEYIGNVFDIPSDWNEIASKFPNRSGEMNYKKSLHLFEMKTPKYLPLNDAKILSNSFYSKKNRQIQTFFSKIFF